LHPDGQDIVEYPIAESTNKWNYIYIGRATVSHK